jgi:hypothetical protein
MSYIDEPVGSTYETIKKSAELRKLLIKRDVDIKTLVLKLENADKNNKAKAVEDDSINLKEFWSHNRLKLEGLKKLNETTRNVRRYLNTAVDNKNKNKIPKPNQLQTDGTRKSRDVWGLKDQVDIIHDFLLCRKCFRASKDILNLKILRDQQYFLLKEANIKNHCSGKTCFWQAKRRAKEKLLPDERDKFKSKRQFFIPFRIYGLKKHSETGEYYVSTEDPPTLFNDPDNMEKILSYFDEVLMPPLNFEDLSYETNKSYEHHRYETVTSNDDNGNKIVRYTEHKYGWDYLYKQYISNNNNINK